MTANNSYLAETYSDVLALDSDLEKIITVLDRAVTATYVTAAPPTVIAAIQRLAAERRDNPRRSNLTQYLNPTRWLPRRLGVFPLVLALFVMVAIPVAAYQSIPTIQRLLSADSGTGHVIATHLGHELNLSQTIAGYTVTLRWAYMDSNRVVVAYTVQQPDGLPLQRRVLSNSSLSDSRGIQLTFLGGPENVGGAYTESFDTAGLASSVGPIPLHLVIPLFTDLKQTDIAYPQATSVVVPQVDSRQFVFDFTVIEANATTVDRLAAARTVSVNQTVTVGGKAITLERVVLSPSETRLYLRGSAIKTTQVMPVLTAGNWNSEQPSTWTPDAHGDARSWTTSDGQVVISYLASLSNEHGEWSLVMNPGERVAGTQATPAADGGPWVFRFHIP